MIIPLRLRHLFYHDASDHYMVEYLSRDELGLWFKSYDDGNVNEVTGLKNHEQEYIRRNGATILRGGGRTIPLRWRYLAWFDHKDDQYYQEMYLTFEQARALFGAFDDVHCPDDVTGQDHHEDTFKRIKQDLDSKLRGT